MYKKKYIILFTITLLNNVYLQSIGKVRVLLAQGDATASAEWQFTTTKKSFLCVWSDNQLMCNGKKVEKNALRMSAKDNVCAYLDKKYAGDIALIIENGHWYVINNIPLEEYVYSVLRSESWPGWPLEVNKVFAVMVRTYAVNKIITSRAAKKKSLFDIRATNVHQTYHGVHDFEHLKQAVDETKHLIVSYNKQPIIAMYDSCCGGVIPAQVSGFDFKNNPYLARSYPCTYCNECKLYRWKVEYSAENLLTLLQKELPGIRQLKDLRMGDTDTAGKVRELIVKTGRTRHKVSGNQMYNVCKEIKSFCYTVKKQGSRFIFEGKGLGHHMGVCQWGVRAMVKAGFLCKDILIYYYPGTELMRLINATT